jgi:hypothetical protein
MTAKYKIFAKYSYKTSEEFALMPEYTHKRLIYMPG